MEVMSPFSRQSEVLPLIEQGATELYCGLVTKQWEKGFTLIGSINLRHDRLANLSSFKELQASVKAAESHNVPVFLTLNAHFYSGQQLPIVIKQAEKALDCGVASLIISDPVLVRLLREKFPNAKISLSTGQPCFNSMAMRFFKGLGVERIVLPRHLSPLEIAGLAKEAKKAGIETEAFVMNVICPFIDGLCTFQHIVEPSHSLGRKPLACRAAYDVTASGTGAKKDVAASHVKLWSGSTTDDCGLCAIHSFSKSDITSLKIAGRAHSIEKKLSDVKAVKEAISTASLPKDRFNEEMQRIYFHLFKKTCEPYNCYYPSSGRWNHAK